MGFGSKEIIKYSKIKNIKHIGKDRTFDIEMIDEPRNFLANDIVSHNSHSCAYAYVAFQMAYLKCYYRKYFNLAVLNSEEKQEKIDRIIDDCDKHGIHINAFNINEMSVHFTINKDGEINAGARIVKGLGERTIETIIKHKPYKNFEDFMNRAKSETPKGGFRKIPNNVIKILYDYDFFENAWGKAENRKVEEYLDSISATKNKKKGGKNSAGKTKGES